MKPQMNRNNSYSDSSKLTDVDYSSMSREALIEELKLLKSRMQEEEGKSKKLFNDLTTSNKKMTLALRAARQGLFDFNLENGEVGINDQFELMLGYNPGELQMTFEKWLASLHPEDKDIALKSFEDYRNKSNNEYKVEFRFKTKSGGWKWILAAGEYVEWDTDGNPIRMLGTHTDIDYLKEIQEELVKSRRNLQAILDNTLVGIARVSPEGKPVYVNSALCDMLEYSSEELTKMTFTEFTHQEDISIDLENYNQLLKNEISNYSIDKRFISKNGKIVWVSLTVSAIRDIDGKVVNTVAIVENITRKKREESIQEALIRIFEFSATNSNKDSLQKILDEAENLVSSKIGFYHFVEPDQKTLKLQTWSTNTLKLMCKLEGSGSHYPVEEAGVWADCVREKKAIVHNDYAGLKNKKGMPDGHAEVVRELVLPVIRNKKVVAVIGVGNKDSDYEEEDIRTLQYLADVTWDTFQRLKVEESLAESEILFRNVFENSPIGISRTGVDGSLMANKAFSEIIGYSEQEMKEKNWKEITFPDDIDESEQAIKKMMTEKVAVEFTKRYIHKDGHIVWTSVRSTPQLNSSGETLYMITTVNDITEKKSAEAILENTLNELERSNKELEQFAYFASHDLQEPLRKVKNYSDLIIKRYRGQLDEKADRFFEIIDSGVNRMQKLIRDLLELSRVSTRAAQFQKVNLNEIIAEVEETLEFAIEKANGKLTYETLPDIMADKGQTVLLFQNLISNSIKFREENDPHIHITYHKTRKQEKIVIEDNGIGFDMKYAEKIFFPFERLHAKEEFSGTGIGLAICKKIVDRHNWKISVQSQPGKGSRFTIIMKEASGDTK